jgi:hypothetical protein
MTLESVTEEDFHKLRVELPKVITEINGHLPKGVYMLSYDTARQEAAVMINGVPYSPTENEGHFALYLHLQEMHSRIQLR